MPSAFPEQDEYHQNDLNSPSTLGSSFSSTPSLASGAPSPPMDGPALPGSVSAPSPTPWSHSHPALTRSASSGSNAAHGAASPMKQLGARGPNSFKNKMVSPTLSRKSHDAPQELRKNLAPPRVPLVIPTQPSRKLDQGMLCVDLFERRSILGTGSFGRVWLVKMNPKAAAEALAANRRASLTRKDSGRFKSARPLPTPGGGAGAGSRGSARGSQRASADAETTARYFAQMKLEQQQTLERHASAPDLGHHPEEESPAPQYFAVKTMSKSEIVRTKQIQHVVSEAAMLSELSHPFIVDMRAAYQDSRHVYLVLEYVQGGELFTYLRSHTGIPNSAARFYAGEVLLVFEYLHERTIAYRDLKPENLLICKSGHLKMVDFGFSRKLEGGRSYTLCGTPEYLAPETIQCKGHGTAVDYWALGVFIFEMLTGDPPFVHETVLGVYERIVKGAFETPSTLDSRARDICTRLLLTDPYKRLGCGMEGAGEVMRAPWFSKMDWQGLLSKTVPAPYLPKVVDEGDSSNFDPYEDVEAAHAFEEEAEGADKESEQQPPKSSTPEERLKRFVTVEEDDKFAGFGPYVGTRVAEMHKAAARAQARRSFPASGAITTTSPTLVKKELGVE